MLVFVVPTEHLMEEVESLTTVLKVRTSVNQSVRHICQDALLGLMQGNTFRGMASPKGPGGPGPPMFWAQQG